MTDREALIRAVIEHPADNVPRLLLADYLEENGDANDRARAEFIRVQVELARTERPCPMGLANAEVGYRQSPHKCFMCSDSGGVIYDCENPLELRHRERELLEADFCWSVRREVDPLRTQRSQNVTGWAGSFHGCR